LLSVELSYIETRQETGVVPSGNSSGKSATAIITKETKLDAKKIQVQNREFTIDLDISRIPSPLVKRLVYWLGIGNAKDKPYKSMQVRETSQQNKRKKSFFEKKVELFFETYWVEQCINASFFVIYTRESWSEQCINSRKSG
jgi:hypothetical protein